MIEANPIVVGNEGMVKSAAIHRRRERWTSVNRFLIALAKREEKLVCIRETVIDPHGPRRVQYRINCCKEKVGKQLILVRRGGLRNELEDVLCDGTDIGDLVPRKGCPALYGLSINRDRLCRRGIENLPLDDRSAITRIGAYDIIRV